MLETSGRAVSVESPDRLDLRQGLLGTLEAERKVGLVAPDHLVGQVAQHLVDLRDRALNRLEGLQRVFLQHVERPLDAFAALGLNGAVVLPGGVRKQQGRCDKTDRDDQAKRPKETRFAGGHTRN